MIIVAGSFASNQTYQLMVRMHHRQNSTDRVEGYLLVQVVDHQPQLVVIG